MRGVKFTWERSLNGNEKSKRFGSLRAAEEFADRLGAQYARIGVEPGCLSFEFDAWVEYPVDADEREGEQ